MVRSVTAFDFPPDLIDAQTRLHQAFADWAALAATLPWSVEPMPGWEGETHPHTGAVTKGRDDSPGYTEQQKAEEARLRTLCRELSITVSTHEFWATVDREKVVEARMALKDTTRPSTPPDPGP